MSVFRRFVSRDEMLTLDEFVARASDTLKEFAAATREAALTDAAMDPNKRRPEPWWWRDVAAYLNVKTETERTNGTGRQDH